MTAALSLALALVLAACRDKPSDAVPVDEFEAARDRRLAEQLDAAPAGSDDEHWYDPQAGLKLTVYVPANLPQCKRYVAIANQYVLCRGVPASQRDAVKVTVETTRDFWEKTLQSGADISRPESACTAGAEAIRSMAANFGCTITEP